MRCEWNQLLDILPLEIRGEVNKIGKNELQEIRLRINAPPELIIRGDSFWLKTYITQNDLNYVVNMASRYSPWRTATISKGYLTAPGGHRIGVCGEVVWKDGTVSGIREIESLCIRVARDYSGIIKEIDNLPGSILILGAPGWGKTTLLRDLLRQLSEKETVAVVDEREELFPKGFSKGKRMDILRGCPKPAGIDRLLRTMGPDWIAVDEITAEEDCRALIQAANCGVRLVATAHASSVDDFLHRNVYQSLVRKKIVETLLVLHKDKSYHRERMAV